MCGSLLAIEGKIGTVVEKFLEALRRVAGTFSMPECPAASADRLRQTAAFGYHGHAAAGDTFESGEAEWFLPAGRHYDEPMAIEQRRERRRRIFRPLKST